MRHKQNHPGIANVTVDHDHTRQRIRTGTGAVAAGMTLCGDGVPPLLSVAAGIQSGVQPLQFMDCIHAGNLQLGNRAFLHWVGALHAARREGEIHWDSCRSLQGPVSPPAATAPLQFGPKKRSRKKKGAPVTEATEKPVEASVRTDLSMREKILFDCCYTGNAVRFKRTLMHGNFDINISNHEGTPLAIAAYFGHAAIVRELLSVPGIDVNLVVRGGGTSLYIAIDKGQDGIVRLLLADHRINVNLGVPGQYTPLHLAVELKNENVIRMLLAHPDINVNARKPNGATPLLRAVQENMPESVELLLARGADVNLGLSEVNSLPLLIAVFKNHVAMVRLLLQQRDIRVNETTIDGITPLCAASQEGHEEIVRLLLQKGADPDILTNEGTGPVLVAVIYRHPTILAMLLDAGADAGLHASPTGAKISFYEIAQLMGQRELINLLENHQRSRPAHVSRPGKPPVEDDAVWSTPPATPPPEWSTSPATPAPQWSTPPSTPPPEWRTTPGILQKPVQRPDEADLQHADTSPVPAHTPDSAAVSETKPAGTTPATSAAERPLPVACAGQPGQTQASSPLAMAKDALINEVLKKLDNQILDPAEGIWLMADARAASDLDMICAMYNRLAGMERERRRNQRRQRHRHRLFAAGAEPAPAHTTSPRYVVGKRGNLDSDAAEAEISKHLDPASHRFVSQAVNDMEFGRGKPTSGYPGLLHASAGIPGVGSCSVFYYPDVERNRIRVVGTGHHLDRETYQLDYAADELRGCRTLRLS